MLEQPDELARLAGANRRGARLHRRQRLGIGRQARATPAIRSRPRSCAALSRRRRGAQASLEAARPRSYGVAGKQRGGEMTFSYSAVWDDTLALLRAHGGLLAAIAGVFVFLPSLLARPFPAAARAGDPAPISVPDRRPIIRRDLLWFVLQSFVGMVGTAAMLRLVLAPRITVGGAILFGALLLPTYFCSLSRDDQHHRLRRAAPADRPGLYLCGACFLDRPGRGGGEQAQPDRRADRRGFALSRGPGLGDSRPAPARRHSWRRS